MIESTCPFKLAEKPATPRTCWGCGAPLPKFKRKWCSEDCSSHDSRWYENHKWAWARPLALRHREFEDWPEDWLAPGKRYWPALLLYDGPREHWDWRTASVTMVPRVEVTHHVWICDRCGSLTNAPEVHHKMPWDGGPRNEASCKNHQSALEVLCHACHAEETARQAAGRAGARRGEPQIRMAL